MENNQQRYIEIDGEQIAVSEEIYRAYKRPLWAEHKRREREKNRTGGTLSLEKFAEDGFEVADPADMVEFVAKKMLYEALYVALDKLNPENRRIAELFGAGLSERDIAAEIGLSQRGVNKRKNKIFEQLREKLKDFL